MVIQIAIKTSRLIKPHWPTESATDKNLSEKASSRNASTTFTEFSQPPDLGIEPSIEGKTASNVNGMASATEKPVIPIIGESLLPDTAASTSNVPMIGPVHENETNTKTSAIRNTPMNPPVLSALLSIAVVQLEGN